MTRLVLLAMASRTSQDISTCSARGSNVSYIFATTPPGS